jgi:hypothetical protein
VGPTNKSRVKEKGGEQRWQGFLRKGFRTRGGIDNACLQCTNVQQTLVLDHGQNYMLVVNKCRNRIWFSTMGRSNMLVMNKCRNRIWVSTMGEVHAPQFMLKVHSSSFLLMSWLGHAPVLEAYKELNK